MSPMPFSKAINTFNQNRRKFIFIFLMMFLFSLAVSVTVYLNNQNNISKIVTTEIHNFVLNEDFTQVRNYVLPLIPSIFSQVNISKATETKFEASSNENPLFPISIQQSISSSKNSSQDSYTVLFYFSPYTMFYLSLFMTIVAFVLTIPFVYFEQKSLELKKQESLSFMSRKLAHDIRSPLSTLNLVSAKIENPNLKEIQDAVINQINALAEDLLGQSKKAKQLTTYELLEQLKKECQVKSKHIDQTIIFETNNNLLNNATAAPTFLYSGLNNLIQNSIEASPENSKILVLADVVGSQIKIQVIDRGHGIPQSLLEVLGTKEIFSNKKSDFSGNGLAVFNLNQELLKIRGQLNIKSEENNGTTITLLFPNQ